MIKKNHLLSVLILFTVLILSSCKEKTKRVVIWTDCSEFAQYIELFNRGQTKSKAVLVYKENPSLSLPPAKDEVPPDIVISSWLRNNNTSKYFKSLDYLFDRKNLTSTIFYPQLLKSGKVKQTQYLIPVSFNLPAVIFSTENKDFITDNYTLSIEQIRSIGSSYNQKDKKGLYTRIGFTPLNNDDFLYLTAKLNDAEFREVDNRIVFNEQKLEEQIAYLKDWVTTENTSASVEQDFSYKYLFMPEYRQITSDRTLLAYTTSSELFTMMKNQNTDMDYRWICKDNSIPIEDSFRMLGIYKDARNQVGATEFITWFFQAENQKAIIEKKASLGLDIEQFGIADGFSSLRNVNQNVLTTYYTQMFSNMPPAQMLTVPTELPSRWESYKTSVVEAYIKNKLTAEKEENITPYTDFEKEWRRKLFD